MKKISLIILAFVLAFNCVGAMATEAVVSVEAVANALGLTVDYDEKTDSLFVNGIDTEAKKGDGTTLYINGFKYEGYSNLDKKDGEFYLPVEIAEAAFDVTIKSGAGEMTVTKKSTVVERVEISPEKTYAIINCQSGKALTAEGNDLFTAEFTKDEGQEFKILDSGTDGFYHIRTVETDRNLDVYNHWMDPGVKIIVWEVGGGDNQKFSIEFTQDGAYITARGRELPIDEYEKGIVQNTIHGGKTQLWKIVEFDTYKPQAE